MRFAEERRTLTGKEIRKISTAVKRKRGHHLVATHEIAATLIVGGARERITGRVSFHLVTQPDENKKPQVAQTRY